MPFQRIAGSSEMIPKTLSAGRKIVPVALTTGQSTAAARSSRSVRIPIRLNASVGRWRLHVRNWNPRLGKVIAARVNFTGLWLADTPGNGAVTGTPHQLLGGFLTPEDGSQWVSSWFDAPLGEDVERLLCFGYTTSAAPPALAGGSYQHSDPAQAISYTTHNAFSSTPFDIWLEAEVPAATPIIAVIGDSLAAGTGATLPVHESWVAHYARRVRGLPMLVAYSGDSMHGFLVANPDKVSRWSGMAPADAVVWALGSNDIASARPLTQLQADFETLLPIIEGAVGPVRYASTVQPRNRWDSLLESKRNSWNAWLTSRPEFQGTLDFASVVSSDGRNLRPEFDSGDGTHLNTAGYAAEAASIKISLLAGTSACAGQSEPNFKRELPPHLRRA